MSSQRRPGPRKPATKFPNLRKKMQQRRRKIGRITSITKGHR